MLANFDNVIRGCIKGDRSAQESIYREFYGYAMTVCLPYGNTDFEAEEMVNDGFMKVFDRISSFDPNRAFKPWFRRIMINSAIDHIRSQRKHYLNEDIDTQLSVSGEDLSVIDAISAAELMSKVQELPPAYKSAFLLYVVEGFKHHEIAEKLGISEGTSKSNLAKAKKKLQESLRNWEKHG